MATSMTEIIEKSKKVKPIGQRNGINIVSFEEQVAAAQADIMNRTDMGIVKMNQDGTVAQTPTRYAAVNMDSYYINRYKLVKGRGNGKDKMLIVTDYRAITEQASGRVYAKQIPAYLIGRNDAGELELEKTVTVSDAEFVAEFTHTLKREAMAEILPLLTAGVDVTKDDISI